MIAQAIEKRVANRSIAARFYRITGETTHTPPAARRVSNANLDTIAFIINFPIYATVSCTVSPPKLPARSPAAH